MMMLKSIKIKTSGLITTLREKEILGSMETQEMKTTLIQLLSPRRILRFSKNNGNLTFGCKSKEVGSKDGSEDSTKTTTGSLKQLVSTENQSHKYITPRSWPPLLITKNSQDSKD